MTNYPTWRYHKTRPARIITGPDEEATGWVESPADLGMEARIPTTLAPLGTKSNMELVKTDTDETDAAKEARLEAEDDAKVRRQIGLQDEKFKKDDADVKAKDAVTKAVQDAKKPRTTR